MPLSEAQRQAAVVALVDRQAAASDALTERLKAMVSRLIRGFRGNWYRDADVTALADGLARLVRTGQLTRMRTSQTYLAAVMRQMGAPPPSPWALDVPDSFGEGVTLLAEFERLGAEYRIARLDGLDELAALERADRRAQVRADLDMQRAATDGERQTLQAWGATGWRRVLRPYLSKGGVCGLCVAASDRMYRPGELRPIHARCKCLALPIVVIDGKTYDPGDGLNEDSLRALYRSAGSSAAADLKRVRFAVREHSELGPLLVSEGHHFTGRDRAA